MKAFINCERTKILSKRSSLVASDLKHVRHVLVIVHVRRLLHAEMFRFNLAHGPSVFVLYDYGKIDGPALRTLHHSLPFKRRESSD